MRFAIVEIFALLLALATAAPVRCIGSDNNNSLSSLRRRGGCVSRPSEQQAIVVAPKGPNSPDLRTIRITVPQIQNLQEAALKDLNEVVEGYRNSTKARYEWELEGIQFRLQQSDDSFWARFGSQMFLERRAAKAAAEKLKNDYFSSIRKTGLSVQAIQDIRIAYISEKERMEKQLEEDLVEQKKRAKEEAEELKEENEFVFTTDCKERYEAILEKIDRASAKIRARIADNDMEWKDDIADAFKKAMEAEVVIERWNSF